MARRDEWEECQTFSDRGPAEAVCARLVSEGVPAQIEVGALEGAVDSGFRVVVPCVLAHRARWILAQLPPSEEELEYMATGKLPGQDSST